MNNGMTSASNGTICTMSTRTSTAVRNRKRNRPTATAASIARTQAMATVIPATVNELRRYRRKLASTSTYLKFSKVKEVGSSAPAPDVALSENALTSMK